MSAEILLDPPVQRAVIDHLTDAIALYDPKPVGVSNKISTGRCVRVVLTGGGETSSLVLTRAQLTIDTYGATATEASDLMRLVSGLLLALAFTTSGDVQFYAVTPLGGGTDQVDPDTQRPKFTRTFSLGARAEILAPLQP